MNYNDAADGREDLSWQEQGSDYNSDFSMPSDNDNDDEFDEKNESKCFVFYRHRNITWMEWKAELVISSFIINLYFCNCNFEILLF